MITGCASGFGRELVTAYLSRGWTVYASMRRLAERGESFRAEKTKYGERLRLLELDVASPTQRESVALEIARTSGGRLDCLVNNAGYGLFGALEDLSEKQLRAQFDVNFFGLALLTQECLPLLRATRGRVINLSSVLGFATLPLSSAYCASKYAVEGLSEALRYELSPFGVQVTLIEPGGFATRFTDSSVWGENSLKPESPYTRGTSKYQALRTKAGRGKTLGNPDAVVRTIVRASSRRHLPMRIRCGTDAGLAYFFRKLLPGRLWMAITEAAFKKILT